MHDCMSSCMNLYMGSWTDVLIVCVCAIMMYVFVDEYDGDVSTMYVCLVMIIMMYEVV